MFERFGDWLSFSIHSGQKQDPLFCSAQLAVAALQKADTRFVARERILEAELSVFQITNNAVQGSQGLFECQVTVRRVVHACIDAREIVVLDTQEVGEFVVPSWG